MESTTLKQQIADYKKQNPKARTYNIAQGLGVSEMEVLEQLDIQSRTYLGNNYQGILSNLAPLQTVMALTRNEHAVSETKGIYDHVSFMDNRPVGIAHNDIIDMRYFTSDWAHVYAATFEGHRKTMHSLQFFDKYGRAIHKVYALKDTDLEAYKQLVQKYGQKEGRNEEVVDLPEAAPHTDSHKKTDHIDIDLGAFQTQWLNLKDTHNFFSLLKKYDLSRQQSFRLAPKETTYQVAPDAIIHLMKDVAQNKTPIMVFLGNGSCLQIFTGEIKKIVPMDNWFNIMDKAFNLHLKMDSIDEAWVVKKYTDDGIVHSLELYDKQGKQILAFFGKRKPGIPELETWRKALLKLPKLTQAKA